MSKPFTDPAQALTRVASIMHHLRGPEGCPWTAAQTLEDLVPYMIEEAHEAAHAALSASTDDLCEELGDVLLQVLYMSEIMAERGHFSLKDVADKLAQKLIRRHPHVYSDQSAMNPGQVARQWEQIKARERADKAARRRAQNLPELRQGRLSGIPTTLPALARAHCVGDKASGLGFDWPDATGPMAKVHEELAEATAAIAANSQGGSQGPVVDELGDLLFAVVNLCRHHGVGAEQALHQATDKFTRRFIDVEQHFARQNPDPEATGTLDELQRLWDEAKTRDPIID